MFIKILHVSHAISRAWRKRLSTYNNFLEHSRETFGAFDNVVGDRLLGVGHVAVQHVADDAEPLEHVHAATDVHVGGRVHTNGRPQHKQQDCRDGQRVHRRSSDP